MKGPYRQPPKYSFKSLYIFRVKMVIEKKVMRYQLKYKDGRILRDDEDDGQWQSMIRIMQRNGRMRSIR